VAKYLLDTHAVIHALIAPHKLGRKARTALMSVAAGRDDAWVPAVAVAELIMLRERGRTTIGISQLQTVFEQSGWALLPLDINQLNEFAALAALVDPFDRLIAAAARSQKAKLISADRRIADSGLVEVVWG
jgi:PIN domain nuclease of toxin-antitoxin system